GLWYYPLTSPFRLLDTRANEPACDMPGTPLAGGVTRPEPARAVTCCSITVPSGAQAVVGNAAVVNAPGGGGGYGTLWPSGRGAGSATRLRRHRWVVGRAFARLRRHRRPAIRCEPREGTCPAFLDPRRFCGGPGSRGALRRLVERQDGRDRQQQDLHVQAE